MQTEDTPVKRKRSTTKGDATREAIKQAAKRAIAVDGFVAATVADIMAQADRSPGAFYRYFTTKEQLLRELLEDFRQKLKSEVNRSFSATEEPLENLTARLAAFWKIYREYWPIATAAFQLAMVDPQFARAWRSVRQQGIRGLSVMIKIAQKEGYSPNIDAELAASALCSMIEYTCYNWTSKAGDFPDRFIDDETAIRVLTQLVVHSVGWRTGGADDLTCPL